MEPTISRRQAFPTGLLSRAFSAVMRNETPQGPPAQEATSPALQETPVAREEVVVDDEVSIVSSTLPAVRAPRHLHARTRSTLKKLLLESPQSALLDIVTEQDVLLRRSLIIGWLDTQATQGKLPSCFSRERDTDECVDWVEDHQRSLLRSLFEELDTLRTYRITDNADLSRAIAHINGAMASHWKYCHH